MLIEAKWPCSGFGTLPAGYLKIVNIPLMLAFTRMELNNNPPHMVQEPWSSLNV